MNQSAMRIYRLNRSYMGVCVKRQGRKYVITDETGYPITGVKPDTLLIEISPDQIASQDGQPIAPSGIFYLTAETIDPYHIVLDITGNSILDFIRCKN